MPAAQNASSDLTIDRYAIYDQIAAGGMAVVHFGRLLGQAGFSRTVAIKRLHPQFATDADFVAMFLDEARLAARIQHPNVVAPLDVVVAGDELVVVMEYISGETLAQLLRGVLQHAEKPSPAIISSVMVGTLYGLHAAHEATGEDGARLNIVHRDVSPQNIIVGVDGVARVLDFGVAKAAMRSHVTKEGEVKGKVAYMAPEQLRGLAIDRRADVFAAGVVFWEALSGRRLLRGDDLGQTIDRVLHGKIDRPSEYNSELTPALDAVVMRALERDVAQRYATARDFAVAIERAITPASVSDVADWVRGVGGAKLSERMERVAAIESHSSNRLRVMARSPLHTPWTLSAVEELPPGDIVELAPAAPKPASADASGRQSQVSAVTSSSASVAAQHSLSPKWLLLVGAVGVALGGVLFTLSAALRTAPSAVERTPAGTGTPALSAPVRVSPGAGLPSERPTPAGSLAGDSPVLVASSTTAVSGGVAPSKPVSGGTHRASAPKPRAAPPSKKTANCDPPYNIDAKGIRRLKPECI